MELMSNNHSVFILHYHLILVVKYRRKVINDEISLKMRIQFEKYVKIIISGWRIGTTTLIMYTFYLMQIQTQIFPNLLMHIKVHHHE